MTNPFIYADVPDPDVIRVGDTYYMSSTTMHLSPGVPLMKSKDLINWELFRYVYDVMDDGDAMELDNGQNAYGAGSWASSIRYHEGTYYVVFASYTTHETYVYTTDDIECGEWKCSKLGGMYHDMSLFFDDDGKIYLVFGGGVIHIVELEKTQDGLKVKEGTDEVFIDDIWKGTEHSVNRGFLYAEGTHLQKIDSKYYAFIISWPPKNEAVGTKGMRTEVCIRANSIEDMKNGNWERKIILCDQGAAQGGIIDTPEGDWYGMVFRDMGPVGRCPVLAPVRWEDGWPMMCDEEGNLGKITAISTQHNNEQNLVISDEFDDTAGLKLQWQWNHNPNHAAWSLTDRPGYVRLTTSHVATTLTEAKNTLSQRTYAPCCSCDTALEVAGMKDGDVAGLTAFAAKYGYVGVRMTDGKKYLVMVGTKEEAKDKFVPYEAASLELLQDRIYLKIDFDYAGGDKAYFYYSLDGEGWTRFGDKLDMVYSLAHFMGYRIGLFNYATVSEGGHVDFDYLHVQNKLEGNKDGLAKKIGNSNPLVDHKYGADPYALTYDGRVYIYTTSDAHEYDEEGNIKDNSYGQINTLGVISSADMVNWTDHGIIPVAGRFNPAGPAKWASCSWAPAAAHKTIDGKEKFFLYFADGGGGIGVLSSDSPVGPFIDPIGHALIAPGTKESEGVVWLFDPAVLVDDDGCGYLYYGGGIPDDKDDASCNNPNTARVIKLGEDMISTVGEAVKLDPPALFEDSGIHKFGNKYYYSYCSNFAGKRKEGYPGYGIICYMASENPMGPFTPDNYIGEILDNPDVFFGVSGNNHHAIFDFEGKYYITYHAQTLAKELGTVKGYRSTHINEISIDADGKIAPIKGDYAGVAQLKPLDPYQVNDAATRAWQWDYDPAGVRDGSWVAVAGVAFGGDAEGTGDIAGAEVINDVAATGADTFTVKATPLAGGTITLHLDGVDGPVVGTVEIKGDACEADFSCKLTEKVTGTHNLFMVFASENNEEGALMKLASWHF